MFVIYFINLLCGNNYSFWDPFIVLLSWWLFLSFDFHPTLNEFQAEWNSFFILFFIFVGSLLFWLETNFLLFPNKPELLGIICGNIFQTNLCYSISKWNNTIILFFLTRYKYHKKFFRVLKLWKKKNSNKIKYNNEIDIKIQLVNITITLYYNWKEYSQLYNQI